MWRKGCDMTEADGKHWNEERDQPDEERWTKRMTIKTKNPVPKEC